MNYLFFGKTWPKGQFSTFWGLKNRPLAPSFSSEAVAGGLYLGVFCGISIPELENSKSIS